MCRAPPTRWASCVCSGHCALSGTSTAGKQPLFNLHRANLWGCSIHQGQLLIQSAGGYLRSPRSDIDHRLCYEAGCCLRRLHKGLTVASQQLGGPTVRHWPARVRGPGCNLGGAIFPKDTDGKMSSPQKRAPRGGSCAANKRWATGGDKKSPAATAGRSSVRLLFACPALWSLLIGRHYTPHYPIRAWLEGETDHSGGWYALVSLNYTTPGPWLILVQSISANVSSGTDARGGITTNIVQLTFSQDCFWPAGEAPARSSTLDGSHSAVIVFHSGVLSVY